MCRCRDGLRGGLSDEASAMCRKTLCSRNGGASDLGVHSNDSAMRFLSARTRTRKSGMRHRGRPRATSHTVASPSLGQLPGGGPCPVREADQGIIEVVGYNEVVHHFSAYESGID
jgi:hypothetical protein